MSPENFRTLVLFISVIVASMGAIKSGPSGRGLIAMTTISVNESANQFLSASVITVVPCENVP